MVHYSVLLPEHGAAEGLRDRLPELCRALDALLLPFEILCIDDGSPPGDVDDLRQLLRQHACLRVLHFEEPRGTSAALTAGIAAAKGELLLVMNPSDPQLISILPQLVARLSRCDLVVARRERSLLAGIRYQCLVTWRMVVATRRLQPAEDLLWGARRRAFNGLTLSRGAFRIVEPLLARRGARVTCLLLATGLPPCGVPYRPGLLDRLAAWWYEKGFEPHLASELHRDENGGDDDPLAPRVDSPLARPIPQPQYHPADKQPRDPV
jgi:glycosyltransferase involved in cell wall biosynthesis